MKNCLILVVCCVVGCATTDRSSVTNPPSHAQWDALVKQHVEEDGLVDYKGFIEDNEQLEEYLTLLSSNAPDKQKWSREEQLAFWINAYNAFTIKLIVDNYPVESIKDLNPMISIPLIHTVWHKKFFSIGGKKTSLDEIEHDILRKEFDEPRIHFAINCASMSCPSLSNEAFAAERLEDQLEEMALKFMNDPKRNQITSDRAEVSKIFRWFSGDFTSQSSLVDYLNQYSKTKLSSDADIDYLDYDWRLNEVGTKFGEFKP